MKDEVYLVRINRLYEDSIISSLKDYFSDDDSFEILEDEISDDGYIAFKTSNFNEFNRRKFVRDNRGVLRVFMRPVSDREGDGKRYRFDVGDEARILSDDVLNKGDRVIVRGFVSDDEALVDVKSNSNLNFRKTCMLNDIEKVD